MEIIHLLWQGPLTIEEALKLSSTSDYGLYQIYGTHSVTGPNTLLYVGQANDRNFSRRLADHEKVWLRWEPDPVRIYVGRIADPLGSPLSDEGWADMITRAEAVTIYFVGPAYNNTYIRKLIVNHLQRCRLPGSITNLGEIHIPGGKGFKPVDSRRAPKPTADIPDDPAGKR
jgi:hypothetical protein